MCGMHAQPLQWCLTLCDSHGLWPARLLCPWDSPGKNTGVGCHTLLQGIFPTQGSNSHLSASPALQVDSLPTGPPGSLRVCGGCANPSRSPHSPGRVGGGAASWGTGRLCMRARLESEAAPLSAQVPGDGAAALAWRYHLPGGDPAAPRVTISESQWPRRALGFEPSKDGTGVQEVTTPHPRPLLLTPLPGGHCPLSRACC